MSQQSGRTPLLLIGGGGHCASVIDVIESMPDYEVAGIVEAPGNTQQEFMGYPILGTDDDLKALIQKVPNCVITVGQLHSADLRKKLYQQVKSLGGQLPVIISPLARVARQAKIASGTVVMHYALVNNLAQIGENCIINNYALIEHGSTIGAHCHIATRATVNGDCQIGHGCLIGSNATLIQGVTITAESVLGAGSLVIKSLLKKGVYTGSPVQKKLKSNNVKDA